MPALGMAQESGKIIRWLKSEGEWVQEGEHLIEIETDKITVEIEAAASGTLANVSAAEGEEVPVGQVVALLLAPGEEGPGASSTPPLPPLPLSDRGVADRRPVASPVAVRLAAEHNLDLRAVKPDGGRISKADVLAYLQNQAQAAEPAEERVPASPKARRLAAERQVDLARMRGSGPGGAVLATDVLEWEETPLPASTAQPPPIGSAQALSTAWRLMAERVTHSWTQVPHFYLLREVSALRLVIWREKVQGHTAAKITYTDLLVKLLAVALHQYPRLCATWKEGGIHLNQEINIGLAVAVDDGLVVPVIHGADELSLEEIATRRLALVERARNGKLRPIDIQGGTFTLSNLGMYGVDAFNAILNQGQAALLAVGRIAERVMAVSGQPVVQPTMILSLSCDHRVVDGARAAQFLGALADLIEEPLSILK